MSAKLEPWTLALALGLCVGAVGCKKSAETSAPSSSSEFERGGAADAAGDPLQELQVLEGRMQAMGLPVASRARQPADLAAGGEGGGAMAGGDAATEDEAPAIEEAPAPEAAPTEAKSTSVPEGHRDERNRCAELRSLGESICDLEVRICELASVHEDDPVYADACERAIEDCEVARQATDRCVD